MRRPSECSPEELQRFWQAKLRRLNYVLAYVEPQLSVFDWPDPELLMRSRSSHAWSRLSQEDDVAKRVFLAPSHFDWACCPACGLLKRYGAEASGHGLFFVGDCPAETELPAKGPWFNSLGEVHGFLAGLHADTAAMFSKRVVRLDLAPGAADGPPAASQGQEQQKPTSLYKVITNPVGLINHFTALQTTPDQLQIVCAGVSAGAATRS